MIEHSLQMTGVSNGVLFGVVAVTATVVVLAATFYGIREAESEYTDRGLSPRQAVAAGLVAVVAATIVGMLIEIPAASMPYVTAGAVGIPAVVAAYLAVRGRLNWTLVIALALLIYTVAAVIWA